MNKDKAFQWLDNLARTGGPSFDKTVKELFYNRRFIEALEEYAFAYMHKDDQKKRIRERIEGILKRVSHEIVIGLLNRYPHDITFEIPRYAEQELRKRLSHGNDSIEKKDISERLINNFGVFSSIIFISKNNLRYYSTLDKYEKKLLKINNYNSTLIKTDKPLLKVILDNFDCTFLLKKFDYYMESLFDMEAKEMLPNSIIGFKTVLKDILLQIILSSDEPSALNLLSVQIINKSKKHVKLFISTMIDALLEANFDTLALSDVSLKINKLTMILAENKEVMERLSPIVATNSKAEKISQIISDHNEETLKEINSNTTFLDELKESISERELLFSKVSQMPNLGYWSRLCNEASLPDFTKIKPEIKELLNNENKSENETKAEMKKTASLFKPVIKTDLTNKEADKPTPEIVFSLI